VNEMSVLQLVAQPGVASATTCFLKGLLVSLMFFFKKKNLNSFHLSLNILKIEFI